MSTQGRPARRDDVPARDVAEKWLNGQTILELANEYDIGQSSIGRRIAEARKKHPDLPWHLEKSPYDKGPTRAYRLMNDGKSGRRGTPRAAMLGRKRFS